MDNGKAEVEHVEIREKVGDQFYKHEVISISKDAESDKTLNRLCKGMSDHKDRDEHQGIQGKACSCREKQKSDSNKQREFKDCPIYSPK